MQEQSGEFYAGLPTPGEVLHRGFEHLAFDFEFTGDFTALPIRLVAVSHQEFQCSFTREKWVMLTQIPYSKLGVSDDFACVEFIVSENALQESGLASTVSTDEANFVISTEGAFSTVEKNLITVAFVRVADL
jgi:hypothetical protein